MRVAVLNDVHGNLPALEAVLAEVPGDALLVFGGDIVSGPMPRETMQRVEALGPRARCLRGNADVPAEDVGGELAKRRRRFVFSQLSRHQRELLEALPPTLKIEVDGLGPTLFCHGSPRDENEILTIVSAEARLRSILSGVEEHLVVCGHTHHQFDRTAGRHRLVNAGSVGMPYEGRRGAYWALLGPEVEFRRTEYELEAASEAIRASGYPEPDEDLLPNLPDPPSADTVAEVFERQALATVAS